jgi:hypothetical protein
MLTFCFQKYSSNHIQHSIIKEILEKQFYLRIKSILKSKLNGNNLIKAVNTYAVPLLPIIVFHYVSKLFPISIKCQSDVKNSFDKQ